jgi:hypothetical protein
MLNLETIKYRAPSVFAQEAWGGTSDKFLFIPTSNVVEEMFAKGFLCTFAGQAKTRIEGKGEFTRHMLRFRHPDYMSAVNVGDSVAEIILRNAHDGTGSYETALGIFRKICSNGMHVCSGNVDMVRVRHSGKQVIQEVIDASFRVLDQAPKVAAQIGDWQGKELTQPQALAYATAALELRDVTIKPEPARLLDGRRSADGGNNLWHTFNRVQENMVRGGIGTLHTNAQGRRSWRHTRAVKSVNEDTKLNRALWRLTEELAKQV